MGYGKPDVYYQPEAFGLTPVAEMDEDDASYSFDLFVVWKHNTGNLYWGTDVGCSCPSPFEDITSLNMLSTGTLDECLAAAKVWNAPRYDGDKPQTSAENMARFEAKVRDAVR